MLSLNDSVNLSDIIVLEEDEQTFMFLLLSKLLKPFREAQEGSQDELQYMK